MYSNLQKAKTQTKTGGARYFCSEFYILDVLVVVLNFAMHSKFVVAVKLSIIATQSVSDSTGVIHTRGNVKIKRFYSTFLVPSNKGDQREAYD